MLLAKTLIFFVLKKNNNFQLYINYRGLNAIIIKNRYLLFLITKTLNRLYRTIIFIKINLKNTYYQIRIVSKNK